MEIIESLVPPGFRFQPTEEELVGYYLIRKVNSLKIDHDVITDIDLYTIEPWDIQDRCKLGYEEENEWYFFCHKDRKYPTGTRTNRATAAGFWKATGRDKTVLSKDGERITGMRKTLVFYEGRAPNGKRTDWIMHEYRLHTSEPSHQEEGWVVCRAFRKPIPSHKHGFKANWNKTTYHYRPPSFPRCTLSTAMTHNFDPLNEGTNPFESQMLELPNFDSPSINYTWFVKSNSDIGHDVVANEDAENDLRNLGDQYSVWKSFDKLLASSSDQVMIRPSSYAYTNMSLTPQNDEL